MCRSGGEGNRRGGPWRLAKGVIEVVREGWDHDEFAKSKIAATNAELVEERETVKEMLG